MHFIYTQTIPNDVNEFSNLIERPNDGNNAWTWDTPWACINAYILAEQISAPAFGAAINNYLVNEWHGGLCELNSGGKQDLIARAFDYIPKDRVIMQFLVDDYCHTDWDDGESDEGKLPVGFYARCMRRLREMVNALYDDPDTRCYLEHGNEDEKKACLKLHMRFDSEVGHGYFE